MGRDPCWYRIYVRVIDDHPQPLEASPAGQAVIFVANINDPPAFVSGFDPQFEIEENLPLTPCAGAASSFVSPFNIASIVNDPDSDPLTWSITRNDDAAFVVDAATGRICQSAALASPLNFELKGSYSIELKAADPKLLFDKKSYGITVVDTNDAPVVATAGALEVPENSAAGTEVGVVFALDEDAMAGLVQTECTLVGGKCTDAITFAIVPGLACPADEAGCYWAGAGTFEIVGQNDCDTVDSKIKCNAVLRVKAPGAELNYEDRSTVSLMVRATDTKTNPRNKKEYPAKTADLRVDVRVTDKNEAPVLTPGQVFTVYENASISDAVPGGRVRSTDPDNKNAAVQSHFYSVVGDNNANAAGEGAFRVDSDGTLRVNRPLDFETKTQYVVTLRVVDTGTPNLDATETVTINVLNVNEPPIVPTATFTIDENVDGVDVGQVAADDVDAGDKATLVFALTNSSGHPSDDDSRFEITPAGVVKARAGAVLNYEEESSYTRHVSVTDAGGLTTTAPVVINLNNVNEVPFLNDTVISCVKDSPVGTKVNPQLRGTDPDVGTDQPSALTYTILSGNADGEFAIDPALGQVTVAKAGISPKTVVLAVDVTDGLLTSAAAKVTIVVQDVNFAPAFAADAYALTIPELPGSLPYTLTTAGQVSATDQDIVAWKEGRVKQVLTCDLNLDNPTDPSMFSPFQALPIATPAGGYCEIIMLEVGSMGYLNYEDPAKNRFNLTLEICDDFSPKLCDNVPVVIRVTDVNEPPTLGNSVAGRHVPELAAVGTEVLPAFDANDEDATDKGNLHFAWAWADAAAGAGGQPAPFALDASTGKVTVSSALDFEKAPSYTFDLVIKDNFAPVPHEAKASILITVTNENEAPVYDAATVCGGGSFFSWEEGVPGPAQVGALQVFDPDRVDSQGCG